MMIVVTGASGQLGRIVINELLKTVPANQIVAAVRNPEKVSDLTAKGVQVRFADYSNLSSLESAFKGAEKLLMISSSELGKRLPQHQNVIEAAQKAKVSLLVYTSLLRADTSPLNLANEHKETEKILKASGLPYTILRNGWYTENYLASIPAALQHGALIGSAGDGKISSAARADYAIAAAKVLTSEGHAGKIYELAGSDAYTLTELAAEISQQSGKAVIYKNMAENDFKSALLTVGLPEVLAELLAQSDVGASKGGLFDDGQQLSKLIGRKTTSISTLVKAALV